MCFIILLDKPAGITSRQACEIVKDKLNVKKAGHSGTLDANATGLLLIALDEATKVMPFFERMDKTYEGVMHLHKDIDVGVLKKELEKFVGKIYQKPPVRSRVKRVTRERVVYYFDILEIDKRDVKFVTKVEAGTYIRKLVDDIGKNIGGAHLKSLRRISIGEFNIKDACEIDKISKKNMIKIEDALKEVKKVFIKDEFVKKVLNGEFVKINFIEKIDVNIERNDKVAIFFKDKIIGIGIVLSDKLIKTDRIIKCQHSS